MRALHGLASQHPLDAVAVVADRMADAQDLAALRVVLVGHYATAPDHGVVLGGGAGREVPGAVVADGAAGVGFESRGAARQVQEAFGFDALLASVDAVAVLAEGGRGHC